MNLQTSVFRPLIAKHSGWLVKLMGDGLIAEFTSVVEAVSCAIAMQTALSSEGGSCRSPSWQRSHYETF
jgi:class 3 adenylate cyclase